MVARAFREVQRRVTDGSTAGEWAQLPAIRSLVLKDLTCLAHDFLSALARADLSCRVSEGLSGRLFRGFRNLILKLLDGVIEFVLLLKIDQVAVRGSTFCFVISHGKIIAVSRIAVTS